MPLTASAHAFLTSVNRIPKTAYHTLPEPSGAIQARQAYDERPPSLAPEYVALYCVKNTTTTPKNPSDTYIPIRIYTPEKSETPLPICVFYHGGGMVIGTLDGYDTLCRQLAFQSGCVVVSVDYRLAPEHKFPAAVNDAFNALLWVSENAESFNGNASKIAIAGDSAGGNLAAVVAIMARDHKIAIQYQVLVYPATAPHADSASHHTYAEGYFLERDTVLWFHRSYIRTEHDRNDYRYAPLIADNLSQLPPALVIIAEYDTLRDEGAAYAEKLKASGVDTQLIEYKGMFHPFVSLAGILDEGKEAITTISRLLRFHLF